MINNIIRSIIEWMINHEYPTVIIILLLMVTFSSYLIVSIQMKRKASQQIKAAETQSAAKFLDIDNKFNIIIKAQKQSKQQIDNITTEKKNDSAPYDRLSKVYDFNIQLAIDEGLIDKKTDEKFLEFLYAKFSTTCTLSGTMISFCNNKFKGVNITNAHILSELKQARSKIINSCIALIGSDFAVLNTTANNDLVTKMQTSILTIINDKSRNDKINRILTTAEKFLADTINISIQEYNKFKPNTDTGNFLNLFQENELFAAAIELAKSGKQNKLTQSIIGQINAFETTEAQNQLSHEEKTLQENKLRKTLFSIYEKINRK